MLAILSCVLVRSHIRHTEETGGHSSSTDQNVDELHSYVNTTGNIKVNKSDLSHVHVKYNKLSP